MRKWPVARYAEMAEWFIDQGFEIVLPGAEADAAMCQEILNKVSPEHHLKVHNFAGKTNLIETASLIGKAQLVFGNETGFVHAAIGMDIPTVCLAGTHHIGYFVPYPKMLRKNLITLTAANQSADYKEENWENLQKMQANFPVQGISLEQAKEACGTLLKLITVTQ
jgi:ADP-heptose:LPS heptosyltransferase